MAKRTRKLSARKLYQTLLERENYAGELLRRDRLEANVIIEQLVAQRNEAQADLSLIKKELVEERYKVAIRDRRLEDLGNELASRPRRPPPKKRRKK